MFFLQILKITGRYFFLTRIDLKGKVEEMIPETLKSIIWQNYLSSSGDDVRNGILTFSSSIAFVPAIRDRLDGRWLSRFICELATSEERLGELHLCRGGEHLDQPLWQGEAKNFWKNFLNCQRSTPPTWKAALEHRTQLCRSFAILQKKFFPKRMKLKGQVGFPSGRQ